MHEYFVNVISKMEHWEIRFNAKYTNISGDDSLFSDYLSEEEDQLQQRAAMLLQFEFGMVS